VKTNKKKPHKYPLPNSAPSYQVTINIQLLLSIKEPTEVLILRMHFQKNLFKKLKLFILLLTSNFLRYKSHL